LDTILEAIEAVKKKYDSQSLPDPELFSYYRDLGDRVIWLADDVSEEVLNISKEILRINKEDKDIPVEERKPIKLLIYSYGGDGSACFSLLDVIALSKTPVYTINMGASMSAGLILLLSGHKRFCLKHSTALIHSGSGGTSGTFEQTEAQMADYKHFVKTMQEYIMERTNIDQKLLSKHKGKEWYIYSNEQVSLGIVDEIIDNIDNLT